MSSFWNSPAWTMGKRVPTGISVLNLAPNKKVVPAPGPGNYNSTLNIGKHNPSWKYINNY